MAITKIHPIKSTLSLAISYITSGDKTDEQILISSDGCSPSTAHLQFMNTREVNDTRGTVLARHLCVFPDLSLGKSLNRIMQSTSLQRQETDRKSVV